MAGIVYGTQNFTVVDLATVPPPPANRPQLPTYASYLRGHACASTTVSWLLVPVVLETLGPPHAVHVNFHPPIRCTNAVVPRDKFIFEGKQTYAQGVVSPIVVQG